MFMTPVIGIVCFAIILLSWFGGVDIPRHSRRPGGHRRGHGHRLGLDCAWLQLRRHDASKGSRIRLRISVSHAACPPSVTCFRGFEFLGVILVTAIPFGIYDLVEAIDNVESAAVAGDSFPTTRVLTADGVVSLIGCLMGNPFINAVYIGHPGWKAMGGRIGYSAATGVMVILLCWFGTISVMLALDPDRRDSADPALHRHADRFAGLPGNSEEPCAGHRSFAHAAPGELGDHRDQRRARPPPASSQSRRN